MVLPGGMSARGATLRLGRRRFLLSASAAVSSAVALSYARFVRAQPVLLQTVPVADGVIAVLGPDATVLAADTADGVVMVDGGEAAWSDALLGAVGAHMSGKPVRALFNTHWHPEQTGSNQTLCSEHQLENTASSGVSR